MKFCCLNSYCGYEKEGPRVIRDTDILLFIQLGNKEEFKLPCKDGPSHDYNYDLSSNKYRSIEAECDKENIHINSLNKLVDNQTSTGLSRHCEPKSLDNSGSSIDKHIMTKTVLSPLKPKEFIGSSKITTKSKENRQALLARYLKDEDIGKETIKIKSRESKETLSKSGSKVYSSFGSKGKYKTLESSFKTNGSENTSLFNLYECKNSSYESQKPIEVSVNKENNNAPNFIKHQRYWRDANLFTVEEVNSNISSSSSIRKIARDFSKSIQDSSVFSDSAICGHRSRKSCQLLSPVKISEPNLEDERKTQTEYFSKLSPGSEQEISISKQYKPRDIITRKMLVATANIDLTDNQILENHKPVKDIYSVISIPVKVKKTSASKKSRGSNSKDSKRKSDSVLENLLQQGRMQRKNSALIRIKGSFKQQMKKVKRIL